MIYAYKYIEEGEPMHFDKIRTGQVDLGDRKYTKDQAHEKICKEANKQASAEFMRIATDLARVEGFELDLRKTVQEANKQKRIVLAIQKSPKQKSVHER
jgi:hypothetical protein